MNFNSSIVQDDLDQHVEVTDSRLRVIDCSYFLTSSNKFFLACDVIAKCRIQKRKKNPVTDLLKT